MPTALKVFIEKESPSQLNVWQIDDQILKLQELLKRGDLFASGSYADAYKCGLYYVEKSIRQWNDKDQAREIVLFCYQYSRSVYIIIDDHNNKSVYYPLIGERSLHNFLKKDANNISDYLSFNLNGLLEILKKMHDNDMYHCDLNPGNVSFGRRGTGLFQPAPSIYNQNFRMATEDLMKNGIHNFSLEPYLLDFGASVTSKYMEKNKIEDIVYQWNLIGFMRMAPDINKKDNFSWERIEELLLIANHKLSSKDKRDLSNKCGQFYKVISNILEKKDAYNARKKDILKTCDYFSLILISIRIGKYVYDKSNKKEMGFHEMPKEMLDFLKNIKDRINKKWQFTSILPYQLKAALYEECALEYISKLEQLDQFEELKNRDRANQLNSTQLEQLEKFEALYEQRQLRPEDRGVYNNINIICANESLICQSIVLFREMKNTGIFQNILKNIFLAILTWDVRSEVGALAFCDNIKLYSIKYFKEMGGVFLKMKKNLLLEIHDYSLNNLRDFQNNVKNSGTDKASNVYDKGNSTRALPTVNTILAAKKEDYQLAQDSLNNEIETQEILLKEIEVMINYASPDKRSYLLKLMNTVSNMPNETCFTHALFILNANVDYCFGQLKTASYKRYRNYFYGDFTSPQCSSQKKRVFNGYLFADDQIPDPLTIDRLDEILLKKIQDFRGDATLVKYYLDDVHKYVRLNLFNNNSINIHPFIISLKSFHKNFIAHGGA